MKNIQLYQERDKAKDELIRSKSNVIYILCGLSKNKRSKDLLQKRYKEGRVLEQKIASLTEQINESKETETSTSVYCVCDEPDRESGFSYCMRCHKHVSDQRMEFITREIEVTPQSEQPEEKGNEIYKAGDRVELLISGEKGTVWITNGRWLNVKMDKGITWKGETDELRHSFESPSEQPEETIDEILNKYLRTDEGNGFYAEDVYKAMEEYASQFKRLSGK